jgi:asparagine synthase (glutamine-hydrolysing)
LVDCWVIRWDTRSEPAPTVLELDQGGDFSFAQMPAGNFVLFDGYLFDRTSAGSEAEQVAADYDRLGEGIFDRLRGEFTLAIWDAARRRLLFGRGPMGLTSAYHSYRDGLLIVSAQLDGVLNQPEIGRRFHRPAIAEYLSDVFSLHQRTETFYEAVRRLPPGHYLRSSGGEPALCRYWDPAPPGFAWVGEKELAGLLPLCAQAVVRCIRAGADTLALSGGFDSVSLAILASEHAPQGPPLHAVSIRFQGTEADESATQRAVAESLGLPLTLRTPAECMHGQPILQALFHSAGEHPSPCLNVWQPVFHNLLREAAFLGRRGLLMGSGGDEMFGVDGSYAADCFCRLHWLSLWRFYRSIQCSSCWSPVRVARAVLWREGIRGGVRRLAANVLRRTSPQLLKGIRRRRLLALLRGRLPGASGTLLAELVQRQLDFPEPPAPAGEGAYARSVRQFVLQPRAMLEMEDLLCWVRRAGFRLYLPFYDRDVMELMLRVHPSHLFAGRQAKAPLRRLVADKLPAVPMNSRKLDFSALVDRLIRDEGKTLWNDAGGARMLSDLDILDRQATQRLLQNFFFSAAVPLDRWFQVWLTLSTELWLQARQRRDFLVRQWRQRYGPTERSSERALHKPEATVGAAPGPPAGRPGHAGEKRS